MDTDNHHFISLPGTGVPYRELLLVGLLALFITYICTSIMRPLAIKYGAVAIPRKRDVHTLPTARWGGVAMYIGLVAGFLLARELPALTRGFQFSSEVLGVVCSGTIVVIVGILDDRFGLDALTKFIGQLTAACVLVLLGVSWYILYIPGIGTIVLDNFQAGAFTVFVCVAMMNAINFLDGLDGLVAGLGAISASAIVIFSLRLLSEQGGDVSYYPPALMSVLVVGVCLGFLPHNFYRAKIFMGDSGALFLGLALAASAISVSGDISRGSYGVKNVAGLLSPFLITVAVMALPIFDITRVVIRRKYEGQKFFHADNLHMHHRLLELGHSHPRAVLLVYLWSAMIAFLAESLTLLPWWLEGICSVICIVVAAYATFGNSLKRIFLGVNKKNKMSSSSI